MWRLDEDGDGGLGSERSAAAKLALKPQREGSVPGSLDTRPDPAWVAKEWIESPEGVRKFLVPFLFERRCQNGDDERAGDLWFGVARATY